METQITATQLARGLSDVLNRVRYRGESFLITRNGDPVAKIEPAGSPKGITWEEFARRIAPLWPPDDRFAEDLEQIKASQGLPRAPQWDS